MTPSESRRLQVTLHVAGPLHGILECQAMLSHTDFFTVCKTRPSSTQKRIVGLLHLQREFSYAGHEARIGMRNYAAAVR